MMSLTLLTTTCNICAGFSGGPLLTTDRQLLGLTIGKLNNDNVHFVLPSTEFMEIIFLYIHTNG